MAALSQPAKLSVRLSRAAGTAKAEARPLVAASRPRPRGMRVAASMETDSYGTESYKQTLRGYTSGDFGLYGSGSALKSAVEALVSEGEASDLSDSPLDVWDGTWKVFYAPHIETLSTALLGAKFDIYYKVNGAFIESNVKYSHPLLRKGWLSTSGTVSPINNDDVQIVFDSFWNDFGDDSVSRPDPRDAKRDLKDMIVNTIGNAAFFPQLSVFPVYYVDEEFVAFKFPPIDSYIVARKVTNAEYEAARDSVSTQFN